MSTAKPHATATPDAGDSRAAGGTDTCTGGHADAASRTVGALLARIFGAAERLRTGAKPLHPRGSVVAGTLTRYGLSDRTGVAWLDVPGTDEVQVRLSRALGIPAPWPDVLGIAIRVPIGDRHADLLMSSTGQGRLGRFVLAPARDAAAAAYSTLMPYRTARGPLLLAAVPASGSGDGPEFDLRVATPRGPWHTFGRLHVDRARPAGDADVAFDAMINVVPGLEPYEWVKQLREGSYRAARLRRGDRRPAP
jgi:hypothetical protein